MRHWLNHYLGDTPGGLARCPVGLHARARKLRFGWRPRASQLAKLFKGGMQTGFQTGKRILEGLELGSPVLWRIAEGDLFASERRYPCTPQGPFVYVMSGSDTYGHLKGLVAKGANENGSDGTIRAAAASLNSIKVMADYTQPDSPAARIVLQRNEPFAFRVMPGLNHSTIVPKNEPPQANGTFSHIQQCLSVSTVEQYKALSDRWESDTKAFFAAERQKAPGGRRSHRQFIVRVRDEIRNDVTDYRLEFHVVDVSIQSSSSRTMMKFCRSSRVQDLTMFLQEECCWTSAAQREPELPDVLRQPSRLDELRAKLEADARHPYIGMNVDAVPRGQG